MYEHIVCVAGESSEQELRKAKSSGRRRVRLTRLPQVLYSAHRFSARENQTFVKKFQGDNYSIFYTVLVRSRANLAPPFTWLLTKSIKVTRNKNLCFHFRVWIIKLSREMDQAEIRFIGMVFFKERSAEVFIKIRPSPI